MLLDPRGWDPHFCGLMIWPCVSRSCSNSFYGNDLQEKSYICICLYWSCISFKFYSNRLAIKDKYWKSPVWKLWRGAPNPFSFSSCSAPVSTGVNSNAAVTLRGLSHSVSTPSILRRSLPPSYWSNYYWRSSGTMVPLTPACDPLGPQTPQM